MFCNSNNISSGWKYLRIGLLCMYPDAVTNYFGCLDYLFGGYHLGLLRSYFYAHYATDRVPANLRMLFSALLQISAVILIFVLFCLNFFALFHVTNRGMTNVDLTKCRKYEQKFHCLYSFKM